MKDPRKKISLIFVKCSTDRWLSVIHEHPSRQKVHPQLINTKKFSVPIRNLIEYLPWKNNFLNVYSQRIFLCSNGLCKILITHVRIQFGLNINPKNKRFTKTFENDFTFGWIFSYIDNWHFSLLENTKISKRFEHWQEEMIRKEEMIRHFNPLSPKLFRENRNMIFSS